MRFLFNVILFASTFILFTTSASAQISLDNLPQAQGNSRFYDDPLKGPNGNSVVDHPSLTTDGFDSGPDNGFGLKQILEEVYSGSVDPSVAGVWNEIVRLASDGGFDHTPSKIQHIRANTQRMQARAFMALATYVMERNGEGHELGSLPNNIETPDKAADRLRSALTNTDAWRIVKSWKDDGVKWSTALENMARTMDLYLALENAYCYYGNQGHTPSQNECSGATTDRLLSKNEKHDVFAHFGEQIKTLEDSKNWGYGFSPNNRYETEVGNASLKIQTAVGYASLTHQSVNQATGVPPSVVQDYVDRALKANFRTAGTDRTRYWGYQTDDGKQFWAEGPYYFRFALKDVLPFWHAIRINGMLDYHPGFNAPDPFYHSRFTEPLHWLADLTTPKGKTPPLDDGNKHSMSVSMLLRWTNSYGADSLGKKFDWIADTYGYGANNNLLPVEISIPRVEANSIPPESMIGNTTASQTDENGEQQIVIRRGTSSNACKDSNTGSSGDCHYLLLNGESGDAYRRGEGHEQPDQLQLLYYINGTSVLMDSGYDNAGFDMGKAIWKNFNSKWNNYYDHNVLHGIGGNGGLQAPFPTVDGWRKRITPENPKYLYHTQHGNADVLRGNQLLPEVIVLKDGSRAGANYKRDVLFVHGSDPYLIDFSRVKHSTNWTNFANPERQFKLSYHVNANSVDLNNFAPDNGTFITMSGVDGSGENAYIYPLGIEYWVKVRQNNSDIVDETDTAREENRSTDNQIKRVDIKNFDVNTHPQHFSVATVIQARGQTPSNAPKMLWGNFSQNHQGWVWKRGSETYDVFIGREEKTSASSSIQVSLEKADSQYPSFKVELPSGKRYGFARVEKSGGTWNFHSDYQVNLQRPPLEVTLSGPTWLDTGEQGTWTASVSGGSGSASYDWEYQSVPSSTGWTSAYCSGTSCSHTFFNYSSSQVEQGKIRVTVTKGSEQDQVTWTVNVNPAGGYYSSVAKRRAGAFQNLDARTEEDETATLTWSTMASFSPSEFVVQHRADSTAAWSTVGRVAASDSVAADTSRGATYRFRTGDLSVGTHQFRLRGQAGRAKKARTSRVVSAEIRLTEAYRLSAYPNPVRARTTIELAVREKQDVTVAVYDVLGRRVTTLHDGLLPAQETRRFRLSASEAGLSSGTYFVRVTGAAFADTRRLTVVR